MGDLEVERAMRKVIGLWVVFIIGFAGKTVDGFDHFGPTELPFEPLSRPGAGVTSNVLMVGLTLIEGAAAKGAVCLDGSLPAYHLDRGHGSGANSWLVHLEGGAWCNTTKSCVARKMTELGSSTYMEKEIQFTGILSNKADENSDFYNWNRVKVRYCDGASFAGEGEDKEAQLQFRGQRIWLAAMEELMSKGMHNANQALLSGCSAGGLASILHCDQFRYLFPINTKVKCLSDAGLFLDAVDVSGEHYLRNMFNGVVNLQRVQNNLPRYCTQHLDPTTCFFPANLIASIRTPLFVANSAFDTWQIQASLTPPSADPHGNWSNCRMNYTYCSTSQIQFLQGFRNQMLDAVKEFSKDKQNGLYLNSCFAHCQAESGDTWFAADAPLVCNKPLAVAVGDWYFDRAAVRAIDDPYPKTCERNNSSSNLFLQFASF